MYQKEIDQTLTEMVSTFSQIHTIQQFEKAQKKVASLGVMIKGMKLDNTTLTAVKAELNQHVFRLLVEKTGA